MPKTALITGGSSGIGFELAKLFARDGVNLVLISRDAERLRRAIDELREQYPIKICGITRDLSTPDAVADVQNIFDELLRDGVQIDFLVNNAGFGVYDKFLATDLSRELAMIQLHVVVTTAFTKLFAADMATRGGGKILNVASTAAFQPGPWMAVYYATKAYVLHYSEAANESLKGTGVTVTCLCPGPTPTNFQVRAKNRKKGILRHVKTSVDHVAEAGYRGMLAGIPVVIPGLLNKIGAFSVRILPRRLVTYLSGKAAEKS